MKKNKFFSLLMTMVIAILSLTGCGKDTPWLDKPTQSKETATKKVISAYSDVKINIALIKTLPGTYAFLQLIQDSDNHLNNIEFLFAKDADEAFEWLDSGKVDAATLSFASALRYYNVGLKATKMFFITSKSPVYLLTKNNNISSYRNIEDKLLYFIGKYSTEEFMCENNIRGYSREQSRYVSNLSDLYKQIENGTVENCIVSSAVSPFILKKYPEFNIVAEINNTEENTNRVHVNMYDCLVISQNYLNENSSKIYDLASLFKTSGVFTNFHTNEAASIAVKYHIASSVNIAKGIILNSKIGYYENKSQIYHYYSQSCRDYYFDGNAPHLDYYQININSDSND